VLQVGTEGRVVGVELRTAALDLARASMHDMLSHSECAPRLNAHLFVFLLFCRWLCARPLNVQLLASVVSSGLRICSGPDVSSGAWRCGCLALWQFQWQCGSVLVAGAERVGGVLCIAGTDNVQHLPHWLGVAADS
jgi:hypothetical protein